MAEAGFYGVASLTGPVGDGVTGSQFASLDGVVKSDAVSGSYLVANEYICGLLGLSLGLPVPPGTIARLDDGTHVFAMLRFGLKGDKPPPADTQAFVADRPKLAARVAVFDCWIMNTDRHNKNFSYIPNEPASVFDHSHALLGNEPGKAATALDANQDLPVWAGVINNELRSASDLASAADLIRRFNSDLVSEACETPRRLGIISHDEFKKVKAVLAHRAKRLAHFIDISHASFPKIEDWGLTA